MTSLYSSLASVDVKGLMWGSSGQKEEEHPHAPFSRSVRSKKMIGKRVHDIIKDTIRQDTQSLAAEQEEKKEDSNKREKRRGRRSTQKAQQVSFEQSERHPCSQESSD